MEYNYQKKSSESQTTPLSSSLNSPNFESPQCLWLARSSWTITKLLLYWIGSPLTCRTTILFIKDSNWGKSNITIPIAKGGDFSNDVRSRKCDDRVAEVTLGEVEMDFERGARIWMQRAKSRKEMRLPMVLSMRMTVLVVAERLEGEGWCSYMRERVLVNGKFKGKRKTLLGKLYKKGHSLYHVSY